MPRKSQKDRSASRRRAARARRKMRMELKEGLKRDKKENRRLRDLEDTGNF